VVWEVEGAATIIVKVLAEEHYLFFDLFETYFGLGINQHFTDDSHNDELGYAHF
jgi:hypothetical protein